jgi:hypothetical protein
VTFDVVSVTAAVQLVCTATCTEVGVQLTVVAVVSGTD